VSMTLQPRTPAVSKRSRKPKAIIVIGGIILSSIVGIGIAVTVLITGLPSSYSSRKNAICTAKVFELAQLGVVRYVGGYGGAKYECTRMHVMSSVYGEASSSAILNI
jgi:hypothetical protein